VPISIGGGINSIDRADLYFKSGADKIILNSSSLNNKKIINEIEKKYGTQSIIQSIDVKKSDKEFLVYCESGKKKIDFDPKQAVDLSLSEGAGEILINNIDLDGSLLGYDLEMIRSVSDGFNCPFLALGGAGNWQHMSELFLTTEVSAACTQNIFHFTEESINSAKNFLKKKEINIRH